MVYQESLLGGGQIEEEGQTERKYHEIAQNPL